MPADTELQNPFSKVTVPERALRPWKETNLLLTGATSGIGLAMARTLLAETDVRGVYIGTRTPDRFDATVTSLGQSIPGFDPSRVKPFYADFAHPEEPVDAFNKIQAGPEPVTDVKQYAAGGMESFLRKRVRELVGLRRLRNGDPVAFNEAVSNVRQLLAADINEAWPYAQAVNYEGPMRLLEKAVVKLPPNAMSGYESSLWASFRKEVAVPFIYQLIADTKGQMVDRFEALGPGYSYMDQYLFVDSGHLVLGTGVGDGFEKMLIPLLSDEDQAKMKGSAVSIDAMVQMGVNTLVSDPRQWGVYPRKSYCYAEAGQTVITQELSPKHPMFNVEFPV